MEDNRENINASENDENIKEEEAVSEETAADTAEPKNEETETSEQVTEEKKPEAEVKTEEVHFHSEKKKKCPSWAKTAGKVIAVIAVVGCASFAGTYAAISLLQGKVTGYINDQIQNFGYNFGNDYGYGYGNGGGSIFGDGDLYDDGSSPSTNNNSAGLGIYIYNNIDAAQIASFTSDSLADDAGLRVGDIITSINGEDIDDYDDVVEELSHYKPGDKVTVGYSRDGKSGSVEVELIDRNSSVPSGFPSNGTNRYMQ